MNKKNLDSLPSSIEEAVDRIKDFTRVTPLEYSAYLSEHSGAEVWLKLENFQFEDRVVLFEEKNLFS